MGLTQLKFNSIIRTCLTQVWKNENKLRLYWLSWIWGWVGLSKTVRVERLYIWIGLWLGANPTNPSICWPMFTCQDPGPPTSLRLSWDLAWKFDVLSHLGLHFMDRSPRQGCGVLKANHTSNSMAMKSNINESKTA